MSTVPPEVTNHWENWDSDEGTTNRNDGTKPPATIDPWRAASVRSGRSIVVSQDDEEELLENTELIDVWKAEFQARHQTYPEHGTIDWQYEEAAERARKRSIRSERGSRRVFAPLFDSVRLWVVLILTGVGVGIIGAYLDILVAWLSDLKSGHCRYGIYYNQQACCSGLDAGEICTEWHTWTESWNVHWIFVTFVQWVIYTLLGVAFAGAAGVLVKAYAPYAFHTGIPEIKAILGGYVFDAFLSPMTLLIKGLGLALSVASGLSLGKEGPLVHVGCCLAFMLIGFSRNMRRNEAHKRRILASAAAAGVSVAFGSPLGAVIFGLEELELFTDGSVIWRAFVCSGVAAVSLQYIDPFGTSKLVLFQLQSKDVWRAFEFIPWTMLAVAGGSLGSLLIHLNVKAAIYRKTTIISQWPLVEVLVVAGVTAFISYPIAFMRVQSSELVLNLFQECDPSKDFHGLCNPNQTFTNIFLLLITAALKIALTAWTFGIQVPAGIFLPSIAIGASLGRAVGLLVQAIHRAWPTLWFFSACPPDPTLKCISPGFYSVIGAAAMLGGVTRMTVSLVVILFEMTGALSHVLPIMVSVMLSKWVGDAIRKEGIYAAWIQLRQYPSLPSGDFRDSGETAEKVMIPASRIFSIRVHSTLRELEALVEAHPYHGFPLVDSGLLKGYITRARLREAIAPLLDEANNEPAGQCTFIQHPEGFPGADLSSIVDEAPMQMRKEMPLETVTSAFQKMNLRYVLFTNKGRLVGMLTKRDVVDVLQTTSYKGALAYNTTS